MILRCTAKALKLLGTRDVSAAPASSDDWYVNLVWAKGRKNLLLVHAGTLFPVFMWDVRVRDLRPAGPYIVGWIEQALREEGYSPDRLGALDPDAVRIAKTTDRRVLGVMNDMAHAVQYEAAEDQAWTDSRVSLLNHRLRRGLHQRDGSYVRPIDLAADWGNKQ